MELLARVKHLVKRQHNPKEELRINFGSFSLDVSKRRLVYGEKVINITSTESIILHHLAVNKGKVVTHSSLAQEIWGDYYPGAAEAIRVYIRHLRQKIEANPHKPKLIVTKPGIGYTLTQPG